VSQRTVLTEEEEQIWQAYLCANRLVMEHLGRRLQQDAGVRVVDYRVLAQLSRAPHQRLRMAELAARTQISPSRLTHATTRMEGCGWVRREPCASDRRGQLAVLTDEGSAVLARAAPVHSDAVRQAVLGWLSPQQRQALEEIMRAVAQGIRRESDRTSRAAPEAAC
jgi:DNA-binding MarR family transcriptional regulator